MQPEREPSVLGVDPPSRFSRRSMSRFRPGDKVIFGWGEYAWIKSVEQSHALVDYRDGVTQSERVPVSLIAGLAPPPNVLPFPVAVKRARTSGCSHFDGNAWQGALAAARGMSARRSPWSCATMSNTSSRSEGGLRCCARCRSTPGCLAWTHINTNGTATAVSICCMRKMHWPRRAPRPVAGCDSGLLTPHEGSCAVLPSASRTVEELDECVRAERGLFAEGLSLAHAGHEEPERLAEPQVAAIDVCVRRCMSCRSCRYLSMSRLQGRCAWFSHCNTSDLRAAARVDWLGRFTTVQMRPERAAGHSVQPTRDDVAGKQDGATRSSMGHPRVAIATLYAAQPVVTKGRALMHNGNVTSPRWFSQPNSCTALGCSLPVWCASAERLRDALPPSWHVALLALVADEGTVLSESSTSQRFDHEYSCPLDVLDPADCSGLRLLRPRARLETAVGEYVRRREAAIGKISGPRWGRRLPGTSTSPSAQTRRLLRVQLLKWHFYSLRAFDAILFADLDVDLFPYERHAARVRSLWMSQLPLALHLARRDRLRLVGSADGSSPLNAGLMLVLPSVKLFEDGLEVLLRSSFSVHRGWNNTGPPKEAVASQNGHVSAFLRLDGRNATRSNEDVLVAPADTDAFRRNLWSFAGADGDQGFFWYMTFVRHSLGRYAAPSPEGAVHWWAGRRKPWQRPPLGAKSLHDLGEIGCIYEYLGRARGIDDLNVRTYCTALLREWRAELERDPRYAAPRAPESFVSRCPAFPTFPYL